MTIRETRSTCLFLFATVILAAFTALSSCDLSRRYENAEVPVFIADSGSRYHLESCTYVEHADHVQEVPLGVAVGEGLKPCPVCSPPRLEQAEPNRRQQFVLFLLGAAAFATIVLVVPSTIRGISVRRQAAQIAMSRAGESWDSLSKSERKRRIRKAKRHLDEPPPDRPPNDNEPVY